MSSASCSQRTRVDDHFAGRLSPTREQQMREHLVGCHPCRDRYARQLKLEALDPRALGFKERLRRGLGVGRGAFGARLVGFTGLGVTLALGAVLLMPRASGPGDEGIRARGPGSPTLPLVLALGDGTEIAGFRTSGPGAPAPATSPLGAQTELAFTYRNGGGWTRLMVFARDTRGAVFWFYPQWTDPASDPTGVELATGPERHELPAAVTHQLGAGSLSLCALVSRAPVGVKQVEAALSAGGRAQDALAGVPGEVVCQDVEVAP